MTVKWIDRAILTCDYVALCTSEKDFQRELRRLNIPTQQWSSWLSEGALATTHHLVSTKGARASIVCMPMHNDLDGVEIAGLLVHEATHVLQEYFEYVGEDQPGKETQAYALQAISVRLMQAYRDHLYKEFDKAVKKDEKEWTTSLTSKPTNQPSLSPPSMQAATTLPYLNALPEGMTLTDYLTSSMKDAEIKTDSSVSTTKTSTTLSFTTCCRCVRKL